MENNNLQSQPQNKITVYVDADDTIMKSSETVIEILNQRYNITPPKTTDNLKDWYYRSIYKNLGSREIEELFESDEFFDKVKLDPVFYDFYVNNKKYFHFVVVTKGTPLNLKKKKEFLKSRLKGSFDYVGMEFDAEYGCGYEKNTVNMKRGIQIDDRMDCLSQTNAQIKILYKHDAERTWNQVETNVDNLYVVDTWKQIKDILLFVKDNHFLFKK